jgi:hypothetical protein
MKGHTIFAGIELGPLERHRYLGILEVKTSNGIIEGERKGNANNNKVSDKFSRTI